MFRVTAMLVFSWALAAGSLPSSSGSAATHQAMRPAQLVRAPSVSERQCLTQLGATQANFSPLPDKYNGAHCSTLDTVKLPALQRAHASLPDSNHRPVTSPMAEPIAGWAR